MDHSIELEVGAKIPAMAPYCMDPSELPKKLPHKREVDHSIELEVGAKIPGTKNCTGEWTTKEGGWVPRFQALKKVVMKEPVQVLSGHTEPFEYTPMFRTLSLDGC